MGGLVVAPYLQAAMPLRFDLTGSCYMCYLPVVAGAGLVKAPGKCCAIDPGHTPRLRFEAPGDLHRLLECVDEGLQLRRPLEVAGSHLEAGAELFVAEGEGF